MLEEKNCSTWNKARTNNQQTHIWHRVESNYGTLISGGLSHRCTIFDPNTNTTSADICNICFFYFFHAFLDQTYGDSTDYVYDKLNVTHSYGLELRPGDNEPNGFLLSSCEIVPSGREILAALKAITPILEKEKNAGVKVEGDEKESKRR